MAIAPYTTGGFIVVIGPIMAVVFSGILFVIFNAAMGGEASFKQVFTVYVHAGAIMTLQQLFTGPLNYFRGAVTGATNLSVLLPMIDPKVVPRSRCSAMIDLFIIWYVLVLAIGLAVLYRRRTQPIAISLLRHLCGHRLWVRRRDEPSGGGMSRKKKIFIGVGIVVVLGAVAFANFKFKRTEGVTVNTEKVQKRNLQAIVSASGKIQPKRTVNISADTMGRVTDLAVNEGDRVKEGQFLLQIDPRNLRTARAERRSVARRGALAAEQLRLALESSRTALKQAQDNYKRQQELWKGGLTTREQFERAESELRVKEQDLRAQEQNVKTQQLRMNQEQATLENAKTDLSKVRIESPINGIVTRRNIEEGETAVIGTMNNAGTVLLTIADMSVIEAEVEVDETDIPTVKFGQPAKITIDAMPGKTFTGKVTEIGNSPIQGTGGAQQQTQATNFKVVVTARRRNPGRPARVHVHGRNHDRDARQRRRGPDSGDDGARGGRRRQGQPRPRAGAPRRRAAPSWRRQAAELKPGQERKEIEGVFVVQDNKAVFVPVKTGIAGEKYFEVLSGLKEGDAVIVGRSLGARSSLTAPLVKIEEAPRGPAATTSSSR